MELDANVIIDRIFKLIDQNGKSISQVSADTGITIASLSRWQSRDRTPSLQMVITLSQYFGVSIEYLIGLIDDPSTDNELIKTVDEDTLLRRFRNATASDRKIIVGILNKYPK